MGNAQTWFSGVIRRQRRCSGGTDDNCPELTLDHLQKKRKKRLMRKHVPSEEQSRG